MQSVHHRLVLVQICLKSVVHINWQTSLTSLKWSAYYERWQNLFRMEHIINGVGWEDIMMGI